MNAVAALYSWFQENRETLISSSAELEFKDTGRGSGSVRLETKTYIIDLSAWDHAISLDIQVIEVKTEVSRFLYTGECGSIEEFGNHLNEFLIWFKREVIENA